jgi:ABC-2 type transport system permease protein
MIGRTLGGATVAVIQGLLVMLVCVLAGFRPAGIFSVPLAICFMVAVALVFAGLGVAIGSSLQDMQGFQLVMNFLVLPIYFLSGALFPLVGLPRVLAVITRLDPLSYGVDGMRAVLLGKSVFNPVTDMLVLMGVGCVLLVVGAQRFSKIEI